MPKVIELSGDVGWEITAKKLKNRFPKDGGDVLLKVDSPGGSVYEGNRLYNAILDYSGKIEVELGVMAASAASYFPLAAGVENIRVRQNTVFMAHRAWGIAIGDSDYMATEANILSGFDKMIAKAYSKANGKTPDEMLSVMKDELWLMGGQAVVDAGFASGVVEGESESDEGEPEVMEKDEVSAWVESTKARMKTAEVQEDLEKWAAKIDSALNTVDVDLEGQNLLFKESAPLASGEENNKEDSMDLKEFLQKNPDAKAEYEKDIAAAAEGVEKAVAADRERFAEVLALSGVAIPENVLASAREGKTVADFAVAELKTRNEAKAVIIEAAGELNMGGLEPKGQVPKKPEGEEESKAVKAVDAAVDAIVGKKEAK